MPLATIPVTVPWATTAEMKPPRTIRVDIIIKGVAGYISEDIRD
jgi:hypothetical protein